MPNSMFVKKMSINIDQEMLDSLNQEKVYGYNFAHTIKRALRFYAYFKKLIRNGQKFYTKDKEGNLIEIVLL